MTFPVKPKPRSPQPALPAGTSGSPHVCGRPHARLLVEAAFIPLILILVPKVAIGNERRVPIQHPGESRSGQSPTYLAETLRSGSQVLEKQGVSGIEIPLARGDGRSETVGTAEFERLTCVIEGCLQVAVRDAASGLAEEK